LRSARSTTRRSEVGTSVRSLSIVGASVCAILTATVMIESPSNGSDPVSSL
jgi:hypothetical protein